MGTFSVLERDEGIRTALEARFGPACLLRKGPDLLVISPGAARAGVTERVSCGTVLLPGCAGRLLERVHARSAVSYGLSPRDSITLSSREGERLCLAVQRELVRVDGTVLERQELVAEAAGGQDPMLALALAGALLLLGGRPEELEGTLPRRKDGGRGR